MAKRANLGMQTARLVAPLPLLPNLGCDNDVTGQKMGPDDVYSIG